MSRILGLLGRVSLHDKGATLPSWAVQVAASRGTWT